jgi:MFS transporter, PPP family, 3-phenylpropionic acid transporter
MTGLPPLSRFLLVYGALYAGYGVQSPYLPLLLGEHGLAPASIGLMLAAGGAIKLVAGPVAGRIADRTAAPHAVLAICAGVAALLAPLYLFASGFLPLLLVVLCQMAALAPLAPLTDSLALGAAAPKERRSLGFDYGWVRGAGSAAFILGSLLAGAAIARAGTGVIVGMQAALLALAGFAASFLAPPPPPTQHEPEVTRHGFRTLLAMPLFRRAMLVAALILGSHAMHDSFAVIRWREAGIGADTAGILWSESVAAEVVVFFLLGRPLLDRLGIAGAVALAALAAILRWGVMAETASIPAVALIEPLHGLSFALLHLACMRLMAEIVPRPLAATALALYGTLAIGAATSLMTLASGPLYGRLGAHGFWAMAALAGLGLLLAPTLRTKQAWR